jgi:hypothetical protein
MNNLFIKIKTITFKSLLLLMIVKSAVYADTMTSANFIVKDPVVGTGGSFGSSASFKAFGSGDITNIGRGTSASFEGREGFLWYPYANQGTFSAVANISQADLTWTATIAGLGWNVSSYKTGVSSVPGGPYTYTTHGLVTSYSYTGLSPGQYCYILQTLDSFSSVIATSVEQCINILPSLSFSISNSSVQFGNLSSLAPRYATTSGGSVINTVAHTMSASSNSASGYSISYRGPTLTSGVNIIAPATIAGSATGTTGTAQFALSLNSSGSATITSAYNQSVNNWKFIANTTDAIATTNAPSSSQTFSNRYIGNISSVTPAGSYNTSLTYVITGNF